MEEVTHMFPDLTQFTKEVAQLRMTIAQNNQVQQQIAIILNDLRLNVIPRLIEKVEAVNHGSKTSSTTE